MAGFDVRLLTGPDADRMHCTDTASTEEYRTVVYNTGQWLLGPFTVQLEYLHVMRPAVFRLSVARDIEPVVAWLRWGRAGSHGGRWAHRLAVLPAAGGRWAGERAGMPATCKPASCHQPIGPTLAALPTLMATLHST